MGTIDFSKGFLLPATNLAKLFRVPLVGRGIVGVEFQGLFVLSLSSGKIPVVLHLVAGQNGMGMSQRRIQLQRLAGSGVRLRIVFAGSATIIRQYAIGIGQARIRQSVAVVFVDGLIKIRDCVVKVSMLPLVPRVTPLQIQFIGLWILCALFGDVLLF